MKTNIHFRKICSFVRREGRLTKAQQKALHELWPLFGLFYTEEKIDVDQLFNRRAETILEIGFGMGASLIEQAIISPQKNFLGIEVYSSGIGSILNAIEKNKLNNIRIYHHDAVEVLQQCIPDESLDKIQIFFPDPWPKTRHHKRRLIQSEFANLLCKKLKPNGILHLATDWQNYADEMLNILSCIKTLKNLAGQHQFHPRPEDRPLTKFEKRGEQLGHPIWDLLFQNSNLQRLTI